jgi:DNA-binding IclR family transcriptional regulator
VPTRIRSAKRACQLLLLVGRRPRGVTAAEAAAELGLSVTTAYHLLATLADEQLLVRSSQRRFVLGPRVGVLADAFMRDGVPPEYLWVPLQRLAEETQETAYLTAWQGGEIRALASLEGANAVRVVGVEPGPYRLPHARATGKLLLAFARPALRRTILGDAPLEAVTERTIVDRAALEVELAEIRERGWSDDHGEYADGVSCVAAPVVFDDVVIAAFTVSAPTGRFARRPDELREAVRCAAAAAGAAHDPGEDR